MTHAPQDPSGWQPPPSAPYGYPPGQPAGMYVAPHPVWAAPPAPKGYKNAGIMMLVSGIKNTIVSLILILCLIWVCVGAFWFLTVAGGIAEIVIGIMILNGSPVRSARTMAILGLVSGVLCGNIIGVALEAIALSELSKPEVEQYLQTPR